jgi:hypothetical protein
MVLPFEGSQSSVAVKGRHIQRGALPLLILPWVFGGPDAYPPLIGWFEGGRNYGYPFPQPMPPESLRSPLRLKNNTIGLVVEKN